MCLVFRAPFGGLGTAAVKQRSTSETNMLRGSRKSNFKVSP